MTAKFCSFDGHLIWANRSILEGSTFSGSQKRPALEMGPPYFDGQYINPVALESANDCRIW